MRNEKESNGRLTIEFSQDAVRNSSTIGSNPDATPISYRTALENVPAASLIVRRGDGKLSEFMRNTYKMRTHQSLKASMSLPALWMAALIGVGCGFGGCHGVPGVRMEVPIVQAKTPAGGWIGSPAIDVSNTVGTVTINVDPKVESPMIRASTRDGKVPSWVGATMAGSGGAGGSARPVLRILNKDPRADGAWVNITITVRATGGVRVRNSGGPVRVNDVAGAIDIEVNGVGDGDAAWVRMAGPIDSPITVRAERGAVTVVAPSGSQGELRLRSVDGATRVDASREKLSEVRSLLGDWTGRLNEGGPAIDLMTGRGDVLLQVGR